MNRVRSCGWLPGFVVLGVALIPMGCGMPGVPLPPSLNLASPVKDLTGTRTGDLVALRWTMPQKDTEKLLLKGNQQVVICRKDGRDGTCAAVAKLLLAPAGAGQYTETLPSALAAGAARELAYFVEVRNSNGRSAGLSNAAVVLAGAAPEAVAGLAAQVSKDGVVLRWDADRSERAATAMRLHRKLLTPVPVAKKSTQLGPLAPPVEPAEQTLLVEAHGNRSPDRALDKNARLGETYEYRAQRVARVSVEGQTQELSGPLSEPVRVETADVFPPAVPLGLAAVADAADGAGEAAIDLSWQPDADLDLAGYIVYRREGGGDWRRISPAEPVVGPAFHDAHVGAGHTYRYAVSAIDLSGHESARSAEAEETVPEP
jgi:hypothetical protein